MATVIEGAGVGEWLRSLEADDRSAHTIRSYAGAVKRFLRWYEAEEQKALEPADLTPVALWADLASTSFTLACSDRGRNGR